MKFYFSRKRFFEKIVFGIGILLNFIIGAIAESITSI